MSASAHAPGTAEQPERDQPLAALRPMLGALNPLAVAELERALRLRLHPPRDLAQERFERLAALAELLADEGELPDGDPDAWPGVPVVPRRRFEQLHGPDTAKALVALHGSWLAACRAAASVCADGRRVGPGRPWATRPAVRDGHFRWSADACLAFVRRCALDLGRMPTTPDYTRWRRALIDTPGNQTMRAPLPTTICKHCGPRWADVLARCGVSAEHLAEVRAGRLPAIEPAPQSVADRLDALDEAQRQQLGLSATQARKLRGAKARGALPLSAAVELARTLDGSLDWLAERAQQPGAPPDSGVTVDVTRIRALREALRIKEKTVREAAGLTLSEWRRLMSSDTEPTLGQIARLATVLRVAITQMLSAEPV